MPKVSAMIPTHLGYADFKPGAKVSTVVEAVDFPTMAKNGAPRTMVRLKLSGQEKLLLVNSTNRKILVAKLGDETDDWEGKRLTLFADPAVEFAGKKVGGIKIVP
jgi:hypothetical protein